MAVHIVLVKLPVAILTHQQFRVKYYYSQSSFRTPPVPSVFEDNPVYRRRRVLVQKRISVPSVFDDSSGIPASQPAENEPCKVRPLSVYIVISTDPSGRRGLHLASGPRPEVPAHRSVRSAGRSAAGGERRGLRFF